MSSIFAVVPTHVLTDNTLSAQDRLVFAVICSYANTTSGKAWPSIAKLCESVGASTSTVRRSLAALEEKGYISKQERRSEGGGSLSNLYVVMWMHVRGVSSTTPSPSTGDTPGDTTDDTQTDKYEQTIEQPPLIPPDGGDVRLIFDYWKERTGRNGNTILDEKRRRAIQRGIKWLGVDGCRQAIVGMCNSPFHQGVNDEGKKYDDISLVFRDAKHAEEFHEEGSIYYEREGTLC